MIILNKKFAKLNEISVFNFVVPGAQVDESFEPPEEGERTGDITMEQMPWLVSLGGFLGKKEMLPEKIFCSKKYSKGSKVGNLGRYSRLNWGDGEIERAQKLRKLGRHRLWMVPKVYR